MTHEQIFQYLDQLQASGQVNMYGAPAYVERDCGVAKREARALVSQWMQRKRRLASDEKAEAE